MMENEDVKKFMIEERVNLKECSFDEWKDSNSFIKDTLPSSWNNEVSDAGRETKLPYFFS